MMSNLINRWPALPHYNSVVVHIDMLWKTMELLIISGHVRECEIISKHVYIVR